MAGCSDDDGDPTRADSVPISSVTLNQFTPDSLLVTFETTRSYQSAALQIHDVSIASGLFEAETIAASDPRRFEIRWADYFTSQGAYIRVVIYYTEPPDPTQSYGRGTTLFTPAP